MELSIVIPVYHTAKNAITHLPGVMDVLRRKYKDFEIIFVIDNDRVYKDVKELFSIVERFPQIRIHQLEKNYGQHFATLCGYYLSKGEFIACVDEDMTHYIPVFCELDGYKESDVFYLNYDKNNMYTSNTRKVLSNAFKYFIYKIVHLDKHSTFRVISKSLRDKILKEKHIFWSLDIMIYNNADKITYFEMKECEVKDHNSGYNYLKLCKVALEMSYEHNAVLMNFILAIIPVLLFYIYRQDFLAAVLFYFSLVVVNTLLFLFAKALTSSTKEKIIQAIRY